MLKRFFTDGKSLITDKIIPQASNRLSKWSKRQRNKIDAIKGPRFTQIDLDAQPNPPAAIEFIKADPVRQIQGRAVSCNGDGLLGHPKVFINLDNNQVASCGYCGRKFQQESHHCPH